MVEPAGKPPKPALEAETRDRILAAAHTVFIRQGTASARTQEIADEAGVNKALLHYYFGTKEALAREVVAEAQRQLFPRVFAILGDPDRPLEQKIRDVVDFEIGFLADRPYLPGFIAAEMHTNPGRLTAMITRMGAPPVRVLQQQFDQAHAAGRMRRTDARQFVVSLLASIVFPFVMRPALEKFVLGRQGGTFKHFLAERRRTLADFFLAGLHP
jgi:AcrR family transcriptional regulator